ncbi:hypothetical protein ACTA71_004952 [Dictyostelium dimigraforme]
MNSLEKIDQQLSLLNLSRKEIPKDGSCLFRCVSESIFGTQNYHSRVRMQCIKYLELNRDLFEPFACVHNPWEKYIFEMKKDGTWGGEVELQAISLIYEVNFIIYIGNGTTNVNNGFKKDIQLAYCHGEHYDLVINSKSLQLYTNFQSLVYEIIYKSINKQYPLLGIPYSNIPLKIWEAEDKIKQIRDSKIVEKLLKTQSVNILDEYEINKNKKKQNNNNNNYNNRNRNIKISSDSNSDNNQSSKRRNHNKNENSNNNDKKGKNYLLLSTDSNESVESSTSDRQLSTSSSPTNELVDQQQQSQQQEEVDEELKEIFRQIELQELEEQRLIGLEKHFPTLPPSNHPKQNKLEMFEVSNKPTTSTTTATTTTTTTNNSDNPETEEITNVILPPVWSKPQNWTEIISTAEQLQQEQQKLQAQQIVETSQNESLQIKSNRNYNNNNRNNYRNNNNNNRNNYSNTKNNNNTSSENNANSENKTAGDNNSGGNRYKNQNNRRNFNNNNHNTNNNNNSNNQQYKQQQTPK